MSRGQHRTGHRVVRVRWGGLKRLVAIPILITLASGAAWAYWGASSIPGGNGASAATSVNQGATPTAAATGNAVTVSWAASTLSNGNEVDGYIIKRYDAATVTMQTILSACTGTITATTCIENAPAGQWRYSVTPVFSTNWSGAESGKSSVVLVASGETTPPVNAISMSIASGNAFKSSNTIFYRGVAAGSFILTNALSDSGTGPASSATASLTGTSTGWTHTPSTVSTPSGGPYVSNGFSWAAGTASGPGEVLTGHDIAGNTAATTLSFVNDSTAPTAGTVTYTSGYQAGLSVAVTFTTGTDSGSGLGAGQLQRSYAPLIAGICGTFSSFINLGQANPSSPYPDSQVTNGVCYRYKYLVSDLVGNQDIATSANVAMVDYAGAVNTTTGLLSQWRLGETTTSSDTFTSGSSGDLLPSRTGEIGANWVHLAGNADTRISAEHRVRRIGSTSGYSIDYTTATPLSADYSVAADLYPMSNITGNMAGVIGRLDTATTTFYMARWEELTTSWNLVKYVNGVNGTVTNLGSVAASVLSTAGTPNPTTVYRVRLSMVGSALKLYVNGVLTVSATDLTPLTSAGKAGIMSGKDTSSTTESSTTGYHLDNFQVTPPAADSKGSNPGDYFNGVTLGAARGLTGEANTAATFDGVNDYMQAVGTTGIPVAASARSVEMWFKTSSAAKQVLFNYGTLATNDEFGLWLGTNGLTMVAYGSGAGDKTFTLASAVNNGAWHQVVKAYDGTNITLYVDGTALAPQAATRATAIDSRGFVVGAIIDPTDANYGNYFSGTLDEVSFYTTALSQTTVTNHFLLGTSPAPDLSGPTGGSIAASGLVGTGSVYAPSTTLSLNLAKGTDPSGVANSGAQVLRATATLSSGGTSDGTCGPFGTYTLVTGGTDPATPMSNTVADQACYKYQYVVADAVGNSATYTSAAIKVDLTAPSAPTLSYGTFANVSATGSTAFYRSAAASGSFKVTASATDTKSGIVSTSYVFPTTLGTNWSTLGSGTYRTYSWSAAPAAPGTNSVTARNNAGGTSLGAPFTLTADNTAPTGTVAYLDGVTGNTSVSVSFTGTDAGSGVGTSQLWRASATLTNGTCGTWNAFSTRGSTNPTSPYVDTVSGGNCYKYQYVVSDKVGNQGTVTSASVVKIDTTGPSGGSIAAGGLVGTGSVYAASTTLSLNLAKGTDPSGVAATGAQVLRATATLSSGGTSDGTCGPFGTYTLVTGGTDPATPMSNTVADQACYKYQYVVADAVGNSATYTSAAIKVDLTAPAAPSLTFGTFTNTYWSSGSTVFYRSAAASGSFRATANSTDTKSGILSYGFPAFGTNWTSTPVSTAVNTYAWTVAPAAFGTNSITATNNATGTSVGAPFTLTADDTAPTAGTVTYLDGVAASTSVSVSFTNGTDAGSGIGTRLLQRASATLTGGACASFGSFATVTNGTNPTSPVADTVTRGKCYKYQYVVSDNVGNQVTATGASIVQVPSYLDLIKGTSGLVSHWRLGDSWTASDTFTDTAGITLQSHTAEVGSPWTKHPASTTDAVVTNGNRIRKNGSSTLGALYYSSSVPASADYVVEADTYRSTNSVSDDMIGIVGRLDTTNALGTYYAAIYDRFNGRWSLISMNNGVRSTLGSYSQTFSSGTTYHLSLDMDGSTIQLLVDGTPRVSVTNTVVTAAGRAGVTMGFGASATSVDNSNGMHLDNFTLSRAVDSWGTNSGEYFNVPTLGATGALSGDFDPAVQFGGTNYMSVDRQISNDFSIEFWFKSTNGSGTSSGWWQGAGLVDAEGATATQDFGISMRSDGKIVAGVGDPSGGSVSIVSSSGSYDDGTWHHVVFTRTKTSGAMALYVDGVSKGTATGSTASLTSPTNIDFGRILTGSRYLSGTLDEISVYSTVLSGATVTSHYNSNQ